MQVDLWVALLRILAAVLAITVLWPNWFQPSRWMRKVRVTKDTPEATPSSGEPAP